jgi:putative SOS response-associated peptidase YedK
MCGRFTYKLTWEELVRLYRLTLDRQPRNTQARYNVCQTDPVDTVVERDGKARGGRYLTLPRFPGARTVG